MHMKTLANHSETDHPLGGSVQHQATDGAALVAHTFVDSDPITELN